MGSIKSKKNHLKNISSGRDRKEYKDQEVTIWPRRSLYGPSLM
jgi:hypothetical protein